MDRFNRGAGWMLLPALAALGLLAPASCNSVPVEGLEKSFTLKVRESTGTGDPVKIDFLWVVDNSTSMCQEQISLSENFGTFTDALEGQFELDPRIAVTTMDMQCDPDRPDVIASRGAFSNRAAESYPPACHEHVIEPCITDASCADLDCDRFGQCDDQGEWFCKGASGGSQGGDLPAQCLRNPNGTVNSECKRRCDTDEECQNLFGNPRYRCEAISENDSGCILPPNTTGCPDTVGPVLGAQDLALFPCLATVGADQRNCFQYEQGLASALAALDRQGPNARHLSCTPEQEAAGECRRFLRDDAYLVIVFVSDEEDCSTVTPNAISGEDKDRCSLFTTQSQGGPLVPVSHYVNRFKSLLDDPARVIVASIAGDALVGSPPSWSDVETPEDCEATFERIEDCDELDEVRDACEVWADPPSACEGLPEAPESCTALDGLMEVYEDTCDLMAQEPAGCGRLSSGAPPVCDRLDTLGDVVGTCHDLPSSRILERMCSCSEFLGDYPSADAQRGCYDVAKASRFSCFQDTYICSSDQGKAEWGARYFDLARRFGQNGVAANICDNQGIGPALDQIAAQIIRVVSEVCLPRPVLARETLVIEKRTTDPETGEVTTVPLQFSDNPADGSDEYGIISGGEECEDRIIFGDPPGPGEEVVISYEGDPGFDG